MYVYKIVKAKGNQESDICMLQNPDFNTLPR